MLWLSSLPAYHSLLQQTYSKAGSLVTQLHLLYEVAPRITDLSSIRRPPHLLSGPHSGRFATRRLFWCSLMLCTLALSYFNSIAPKIASGACVSKSQVLDTVLFASVQDSCCTCSKMVFEALSFHDKQPAVFFSLTLATVIH